VCADPIFSARTASVIALIVAGTRFVPSYCASLHAARILAAINSRASGPRPLQRSLEYSLIVRHRSSRFQLVIGAPSAYLEGLFSGFRANREVVVSMG
jgi:hypothetical protein